MDFEKHWSYSARYIALEQFLHQWGLSNKKRPFRLLVKKRKNHFFETQNSIIN